MTAVRRLPRAEWEKRLRSYGCYPQEGLTPLNTAEWWRWPFPAPPFTVPADDEGYLDAWAWMQLLEDMAALAPAGFQFGDAFHDPS